MFYGTLVLSCMMCIMIARFVYISILSQPYAYSYEDSAKSKAGQSKMASVVCSLPSCKNTAQLQCIACNMPYCSRDHQGRDWKSNRHPLKCAVLQIQKGIDEIAPLHQVFSGSNPSPQSIVKKFHWKYVANGSFGAVFSIKQRDVPNPKKFALKISVDKNPALLAREAHISMLLTTLYVDNGDVFNSLMPVVPTYDYTMAKWTYEDLEAFIWHFKQQSNNTQLDLILDRLRIVDNPVGLILMKLVRGKTIATFMPKVPDSEYVAQLTQMMLQLLLALNDLQLMVGFVHNDMHAGNVLVEELPEPVVLYYKLNNATSFNIKTKYLIRIIDFGSTRVEWEKTIHYPSVDSHTVVGKGSTTLEEFRPWVDMMTLAASLIGTMTRDQYALLRESPPTINLLTAMLSLPVDETLEETAPLLKLRALVQQIGTADKELPLVADVRRARLGMHGDIYLPDPASKSPLPRPMDVVMGAAQAFDSYQKFVPTTDDKVHDMSLQVGDKSAATIATARAMKAGSTEYGWLSALVS